MGLDAKALQSEDIRARQKQVGKSNRRYLPPEGAKFGQSAEISFVRADDCYTLSASAHRD
jgi:hypothetical protein